MVSAPDGRIAGANRNKEQFMDGEIRFVIAFVLMSLRSPASQLLKSHVCMKIFSVVLGDCA